jgi:hypothetical protein
MPDRRAAQEAAYLRRQDAARLTWEALESSEPLEDAALLENLLEAGRALFEALQLDTATAGQTATMDAPQRGFSPAILAGAPGEPPLDDTLVVQVQLRMAQTPTAIAHLLDKENFPLVSYHLANTRSSGGLLRLQVVSEIEGYSAEAVDTLALAPREERILRQLPVLLAKQIGGMGELGRASLNVRVLNLEKGRTLLELSHPIWLLSRNTAPLALRDPYSGEMRSLAPTLGAFVTPNNPRLRSFLPKVTSRLMAKGLRELGMPPGNPAEIERQVNAQVHAIYEALKEDAGITYVTSINAFSPGDDAVVQRVRLPRQSLEERQANCIDGVLLMASLMEATGLHPAIILVPRHAFLGWETGNPDQPWCYLETTVLGWGDFEQALFEGNKRYRVAEAVASRPDVYYPIERLPLHSLRAVQRIFPLE